MEKEYRLHFVKEEVNFPLHKELKPGHGFQYRIFKAHPDSLWHEVSKTLLKEVRKLKASEHISMLLLLERLDEPIQGCKWQTVSDESRDGLNVLLDEIIRLRKKSQKRTGRVSGQQSLHGRKAT